MLNQIELNEILAGSGKINDIRTYGICMGQSDSSKGIMFVLYSELKKCDSPYVNPFIYMGQLADDFENAVINARKKVHGFEIEVWNDEAFSTRKKNYGKDSLIIELGKYKGKTVEELFDLDPKYLFWMANNVDFRKEKIRNMMEQYAILAKEMIIKENVEKSNSFLDIEINCNVKLLTFLSSTFDAMWGVLKYKLVDDFGNRFVYSGNAIHEDLEKGQKFELKCRVAKNYSAMGYNFNVLKVRRG